MLLEIVLFVLGEQGFRAYWASAGGTNYAGKQIPQWGAVGDRIRSLWARAMGDVIILAINGERSADVLGAFAYSRYATLAGGVDREGRPLPVWSGLDENTRKHWIASAARTIEIAEVYAGKTTIGDTTDAWPYMLQGVITLDTLHLVPGVVLGLEQGPSRLIMLVGGAAELLVSPDRHDPHKQAADGITRSVWSGMLRAGFGPDDAIDRMRASVDRISGELDARRSASGEVSRYRRETEGGFPTETPIRETGADVNGKVSSGSRLVDVAGIVDENGNADPSQIEKLIEDAAAPLVDEHGNAINPPAANLAEMNAGGVDLGVPGTDRTGITFRDLGVSIEPVEGDVEAAELALRHLLVFDPTNPAERAGFVEAWHVEIRKWTSEERASARKWIDDCQAMKWTHNAANPDPAPDHVERLPRRSPALASEGKAGAFELHEAATQFEKLREAMKQEGVLVFPNNVKIKILEAVEEGSCAPAEAQAEARQDLIDTDTREAKQ